VAAEGGAAHLPAIGGICREELGWDEVRWEAEESAYRRLWQRQHGVPDAGQKEVPTWAAN
jgi:glycerol-3-phosphate dehydrogenase